jgi:hypothetical protein
MSAAYLFSEMNEKLIELVRICEESYGVSNKKYNDGIWQEKLWGQIGEELKKTTISSMFLLPFLKLLSFYCHRSSNN